ncbi:hypothetical protein Bca52824_003972 [Brassica carinata]|uniref:Cell differentiation protein rcd1 n=1 Tax=Brassica carinata TaxID=52824 RepID=A0A8X7WNT8_BRACI|nr:hypothetical protein Bca52824_003972 [Brassica carinata]
MLQEIMNIYPHISRPVYSHNGMHHRVYNILLLFQCITHYPDTRNPFLTAGMQHYMYPLMDINLTDKPLECLRLGALGVIAHMLRPPVDVAVVRCLVNTNCLQHCTKAIEIGLTESKTFAVFIFKNILSTGEGLQYCCVLPDRFFLIDGLLKMLLVYLTTIATPCPSLFNLVVECYAKLSYKPRARRGLRRYPPTMLFNGTFARLLANRISHQLVGDSRGAGSKNKSVDLPEGGPSQRIPASRRLSQGHGSVHARLGERVWVEKGSLTHSQTQSQVSHTPPPRPPREGIAGSLEDGDGTDTHEGPSSQTRISALQRLAPPPLSERTPLLQNGEPNSESGRLQEVEIHFLEENFPNHILNTAEVSSSSKLPVKERLSLPQDSPIRTLSEDRRHLTASCLVIHSPVATEEPVQEGQHNTRSATKRKSAAAKASGKRKASDNPTSRKKVVRSPLHGVSLKKRRVSKAQNSPRRKLYDESPAPGEKAAAPIIHAAGRQSFFSGPSRGDRELLHSYATGVMSSEEFKPEKRKIPTGSNHLHNK